MNHGLDILTVLRDGHSAFIIQKNNFVVRRLFVTFDQYTVALFQRLGDRLLLERIVRDHRKMSGIIDGNDTRTRLEATLRVFALFVNTETMGIVLVITDTCRISRKTQNQLLKQGRFSNTRKTSEAKKRRFELNPITVQRIDR